MRGKNIAANLASVAKNKAARVLVAMLTLVFIVGVPCKLAVTWLTCEWNPLAMEHIGPLDDVDEDVATTEPRFIPQWTPDGGHVVFTARHSKPAVSSGETPRFPEIRVYVAASDGSRLVQVSKSDRRSVIDHSPSVSPDGSRIAFSSYRYVDEDKRYFEIWTSMLDGSGRRRLTHEAGLDFAPEWLANGDRIAFRRDSPCTDLRLDEMLDTEIVDVGIYTMKSDGSNVRRFLPEEREQHVGDLAWSPDGRRLTKLETLTLYGRFDSSIPSELGNLAALKALNLINSQLIGPIPPELGNLLALETLDLRSNDLSGPIPPEIGNLSKLEKLDLSYNYNLSGCIPESLREQTRVNSSLEYCDQ